MGFDANSTNSESVTALDAVSLVHDPPYVITSPNAHFIPYIDLHEPHELRARADGRFGLEDCFQHPQIWSRRYPWAPCILRKPSADELANHQLAVLWWTPTLQFYGLEPGCAFGELGRLAKKAWEPLKNIQLLLTERLRKYQEHHFIDPAANTYEYSMRSTLLRLRDQPLSFQDTVGQVAEFQRLCLDVNAMLDYVDIYHPRLSNDGNQPKPAANLRIMGAFTNDPEVTSKLHQCGIPVWLIRSEDYVSATTRIIAKVAYDVIPADDEIRQTPYYDHQSGRAKAFPILHIGAGGTDRHSASRQMGSAFVDLSPSQLNSMSLRIPAAAPTTAPNTPPCPDPTPATTPPPVAAPETFREGQAPALGAVPHPRLQRQARATGGKTTASTVKTSRHAPYPQQACAGGKIGTKAKAKAKSKSKNKGGDCDVLRAHPTENRDVWVDVKSDIVPPSIPVWTRALQAVIKDKSRIRPDLPHSEKGFTFPDPNSLAGLTPDQYAKKLVAWLSLRPGTCSRAFVSAGHKPPTGSGAVWRSVLNIDSKTIIPDSPYFRTNSTKEMKTSKVATAIKQLFGQELLETLQGGHKAVYWHECEIPVKDDRIVDLDPIIVREIIWELFEHNFRFEVRALDMIAAPSQWDGTDASIRRLKTICQAIGDGFDAKFVIWNDPFPRFNEGLRSMNPSVRTLPLESLRKLMLSWPNVPASIVNGTFMMGRPCEFEVLESNMVLFYCQSFYDYFGRPPIVPHYIPPRV